MSRNWNRVWGIQVNDRLAIGLRLLPRLAFRRYYYDGNHYQVEALFVFVDYCTAAQQTREGSEPGGIGRRPKVVRFWPPLGNEICARQGLSRVSSLPEKGIAKVVRE